MTTQKTVKKLACGLSALALMLGAAMATPTIAAETTKITLLYPIAVGGPLEAVINGFVADFEAANPDIDVDPVYAGGYRDVEVAARAMIDGGDAPAVALMEAVQMYELIDEGIIMPYDDLVESDQDKAWLNGFYPAFMKNSRDETGTTWGIPFQRSTAIQYWNKDLFAKAGLDPEKGPATWDEMLAMGAQLQEKGGVDWGVALPNSSPWVFQAVAIQNDVRLSSADGRKANFDDPALIEALQWFADLSLVHKVQSPGIITFGAVPQAFFEGTVGIIWTTTGSLSHILKNAPFPVGVGMLPGNARRGAAAGGADLFLFAGASDAQKLAGLKLVKFLSEPERAAEWTVATGYVAPTPAAWETKRLKDLVAEFPGYGIARDQLEFTEQSFSTFRHGQVYGLLTSGVEAVVTGQKRAEEVLPDLQKQADAILASYQ